MRSRWPDGGQVEARAVILAAGVTYRRLGIPDLDRLVGAGVFYGAAGVAAPAVAGENVCVVGGANSAGKGALHLAQVAPRRISPPASPCSCAAHPSPLVCPPTWSVRSRPPPTSSSDCARRWSVAAA